MLYMYRIAVSFLTALTSLAPYAACQEEIEFEDWMKYKVAYGEVKVVGRLNNTLMVLDEEAGYRPGLIQFCIKKDAEFEGAESLDDIYTGDMVGLEYYTTSEGERFVDFISVEKEDKEESALQE